MWWVCLGLAVAQDGGDDDWGESDDVGFGDFGEIAPPPEPEPTRPYSLNGTVRHDEALWVERLGTTPWAKARTSLDLHFRWKQGDLRAELAGHGEVDPAVVVPEGEYDEATRRRYGRQVMPREAFVAGSTGPIEVAAGRQIVGWGEGSLVNPVDVVNPRDMREPGLNDIDEVRLPVTLLRLAWFTETGHRVELMGMPESDFGFRSAPMGLFGPLPGLLEESPEARRLIGGTEVDWAHQQDRWDLDNTGVFGRWLYQGPGLDAGLYAANSLDRQGVIAPLPTVPEGIDPALLAQFTPDAYDLTLRHLRYSMVGSSVAVPQENGLLRSEVALEVDKAFNVLKGAGDVPDLQVRRANLLTAMVGVQYAALAETTIDVEVGLAGFVGERPAGLVFPADAPTFGVRGSRTLLDERLRLDAVSLIFGAETYYGGIARASGTYELGDGWHATFGAITYQPSEARGPVMGLDTHDRVYGQLRWDFQAL